METCAASEVFYHSIMKNQHTVSLVNLYNNLAHVVAWVVSAAGWPVSITMRIIHLCTISPINWVWGIFHRAFETIITPIFTFGLLASVIGAVAGLITAGLCLFVQWLLPITISNKPPATRRDNRQKDKPPPRQQQQQQPVRPATFVDEKSDMDRLVMYEDDDGYQAFTPRGYSPREYTHHLNQHQQHYHHKSSTSLSSSTDSIPESPDETDGDQHLFSPIKEEESNPLEFFYQKKLVAH